MTHQRQDHVKADVLTIPKMWLFLMFKGFKPELLAVKVGSNFKKKSASQKKDTRPILRIEGRKEGSLERKLLRSKPGSAPAPGSPFVGSITGNRPTLVSVKTP